MTDSHRSEDVSVYNEQSLQRLAWAIEASVGQFKLIFAHCNYARVRSQLVERLQQICALDIHILTLKESDQTLYATIQAALGETQPAALMVLGLESVHHLDQMLTAADQVREEFRKHFHFPLVLWVNDAVGQKLMELAPNFESWGTRREFVIALQDLANWLRQAAERCFDTQFNAVPNECLQAAELEAARQDLLKAEPDLDAELEANLESLLGFAQESDRKLDAALEHYQRAALLWQQLNQLERQEYTLVRIAFCYHLKALQHQETDNPDAQLTRDYLQQCQQIFERTKRPDLIANSIATLGTILRDLQDWELLQRLAQIALQVHETENKPLALAQDYGFLAEVALAQERWSDASQFAQKALDVLSPIASDAVRLSHSSRYRFSLALAQYQLNRSQEAISNLNAAKATCNPLDDLKLYLDILSQLQRFYFEQKNYLEAYEIKQKQRSVEQQFCLRAFIGAGRLESPHQGIWVQKQAEAKGTIVPEFLVSGWQRDVEQLVERITKNETKLIVIHGQSGVGKSSLVNAGLIPALQGKQISTQTVVAVPIQVYTNWVEELRRLLAEKWEENRINDTSTTSPTNQNSTAAILEQLHYNDQLKRRTVLIFDQFEEFFFACHLAERRIFFEFLGECLRILSVKVVLSLREDYLHYLLECERLLGRRITSHGILSQDVLYPLNNFSRDEARLLIKQLTERANFHLESGLIDKLVDDLATEMDCVRPIELQVVGAQLQAEGITTLAQYRERGTKTKLVQRYLDEVIRDCGSENERAAQLVLFLLTDEKILRPLKTKAELKADVELQADELNLVLEILEGSGLVFRVPEIPEDRYQLVHDYLVPFIRQQQEPGLQVEMAIPKLNRKAIDRILLQIFLLKQEERKPVEQEQRQTEQVREWVETAEAEELHSLFPSQPISGFTDFTTVLKSVADDLKRLRVFCKKLNLGKSISIIDEVLNRVQEHSFTVAVVGDFKRGKSTFINALLGQGILPSDVLPCSATLTRVTYGVHPLVKLIFRDGREEEVAIDKLADYVTKLTEESEERAANVKEAVVYYPVDYCQNNVDIIDTPGLNDEANMTEIIVSVLSKADVIILTIMAYSPFSEYEREYLESRILTNDLDRIIFVITGSDRYKNTEEAEKGIKYIQERIKKLVMERIGNIHGEGSSQYEVYRKQLGTVKVFGLSAYQALHAKLSNDNHLLTQSRFPEFEAALEKFLTQERGATFLQLPVNRAIDSAIEILKTISLQENALAKKQEELRAAYDKSVADLKSARDRNLAVIKTIDATLQENENQLKENDIDQKINEQIPVIFDTLKQKVREEGESVLHSIQNNLTELQTKLEQEEVLTKPQRQELNQMKAETSRILGNAHRLSQQISPASEPG